MSVSIENFDMLEGVKETVSSTIKNSTGNVQYIWEIKSGPGYFNPSPDISSTSVEVMSTAEGLITVEVMVIDGSGQTASDSAVINVSPGCIPP